MGYDGPAALRKLTGHVGAVQAVAVSADRRTAVSSGYGKVLVWDIDKTDTPRELTRAAARVLGRAASPAARGRCPSAGTASCGRR